MRTREGMKVAKAKGHLRGKQPKPSAAQARHLFELTGTGNYSTAEIAELSKVSRLTIYRTIHRYHRNPNGPSHPSR
jgi:DNA invertase Pin-like site-specific DNA recombinase